MKGQMKSALMEMSLKDADYERKSEFEKDFKFNRKLKDPRFGEVSLIQNPKTRQFLAVKEKRINDKKEAGKAIVNARKRLTNKHPNILSLLDYSVTKQSELCSSFYVLKLFYAFPRSDLHREAQERQKKGEGFSDAELTHILYQQIAANNYLQSKDQHHGDVQPLNIAYDKTNMLSQLIDMSEDATTANQSKQVQKNRVVAGHPLYQSPVTYAHLKKGNLNYTVDPNKEDVYALGLTLLEAGNGKSIQNIYNANTKEVDQNVLQAHIDEFKRKHGNENTLLTTTVETMVHPDEAQRPNFRDLENKLPPYNTVMQFLKDRQENKVHGALQNGNFDSGVTNHNVHVQGQQGHIGQDAEWNFGNGQTNFEYVQQNQGIQYNAENIQLVDLPTTFGSQQQHNVQSGYQGFPMQAQNSDKKVVLINHENQYDNYYGKNEAKQVQYVQFDQQGTSNNFDNFYSQKNYTVHSTPQESNINTTQPSMNQSTNYNVQTITHEPVIKRSYVVNDQSGALSQTNNNITTYHTNTDTSYNYSVQSQPRVEYVTLEPEYRREYITADKQVETNQTNVQTVTHTAPQTYIKKSYTDVQHETYTAPETKTYTYTAPETKTYTYTAPETKTYTYTTPQTETQNVTYTAPEIRRSYVTREVAPAYSTKEVRRSYVHRDVAPVTYSTREVRRSYAQRDVAPVTYTNEIRRSYIAPEAKTVSYTQRKSIGRSYVAEAQPVTYTNEVRRSYIAPEARTVTYTTPQTTEYQSVGYTIPQETVVKRVSYRAPEHTQYVSERVVEHPVRYDNERVVETKVVGNRVEDQTVDTSGLKLVRTYQDNSYSTRNM